MTSGARLLFRPSLALAAFLIYAIAVVSLHGVQKSTWRVEQLGPLPLAASYLFYDKPFGSIDSGLWDFIAEHTMSADISQELPADLFLAQAAAREIRPGTTMVSTVDGSGLGYSVFATIALALFGAHTFSLALGFVLLVGSSVLAFVLRFRDGRLVAVPILFFALTLMLLSPQATERIWIDQSPIGGFRFFVIAGIVPTLHIIFELFEGMPAGGQRWARLVLLGLQFLLLLCVIAIRMSASYFIGALVVAALAALWALRRGRVGGGAAPPSRARAEGFGWKIAVLLMVAAIAYLGRGWLTPAAYRDAGLASETFWHRAFLGFDVHPAWPFGNLAATFACKPEIPEGLRSGGGDQNAHCAYFAAIHNGAAPGPLFGTQYEKLLRDAYWQVVRQYPRQALETYLIYKPLLVWDTLRTGARLSIARATAPIAAAVAVQLAILIIMLRWPAREAGGLAHVPIRLVQSGATRQACSPPPCGEGLGVGVDVGARTVSITMTPLPNPPPQGGREPARRVAVHAPTSVGAGLRTVCGAFALIAAFSLAPQLLAWSNIATSADIICYGYVALALLLAGVLQYLPSRGELRPALPRR